MRDTRAPSRVARGLEVCHRSSRRGVTPRHRHRSPLPHHERTKRRNERAEIASVFSASSLACSIPSPRVVVVIGSLGETTVNRDQRRHVAPLTRLRCGRKPVDSSKMSRWARILDQPSGQISMIWYSARPDRCRNSNRSPKNDAETCSGTRAEQSTCGDRQR